MKFCPKCGNELNGQYAFCPNCGAALAQPAQPQQAAQQAQAQPQQPAQPQVVQYTAQAQPAPADESSFGFAALGFCIPIVGLILYLVWKDEKPLRAKSVGKGALIGVIVSVVCYILYAIFLGVLMATGF